MENTAALSLPVELQCHIFKFCSSSSLASLALVHTSYRVEAEREIYRTVTLSLAEPKIDPKVLGCLETLTINRKKTALVQSLAVTYPGEGRWTEENFNFVDLLAKRVSLMKSLLDLRMYIGFRQHGKQPDLRDYIRKVLRDDRFRLHTLYCDPEIDIPAIVTHQPDLKIIGVYDNLDQNFTHNNLMKLRATGSPFPIIFALYREGETNPGYLNRVCIFPVFYPDNPLLCRAVAESLDQDQSYPRATASEKVDSFRIYLKEFSDIPRIRDIVNDMVQHFPNVNYLRFYIIRPHHIEHPEIKDILSLVPKLKQVNFCSWYDNEDEELAELPEEVKYFLTTSR
ncbi:hypothetical protein GALMADRAFT_153378 [Galerina marginata CBS 339.88]|uniref:Uncharacterized protein n=1 Tax=Galerina marginata (strain CBS 339.88) TaxID=685588 RepID=A0A067TPX4_GALM3|nr:hypothetical protein GALMADRAFT_153378 [Galerina marginata CBS 339.88]